MTRSDFIEQLMDRMPGRTHEEVETIFQSVFGEIIRALEKGNRVELRGFGTFFIKQRAPRIGCDPRTGKTIRINERVIPFFRAGKNLLAFLNR